MAFLKGLTRIIARVELGKKFGFFLFFHIWPALDFIECAKTSVAKSGINIDGAYADARRWNAFGWFFCSAAHQVSFT